MATKKKASSTTLTPVGDRSTGKAGKELVPYLRGDIARCSIQPFKMETVNDARAPKAPGLAEEWND